MFLKMYTGLSCPKLLEQLNSNIHYPWVEQQTGNPPSPDKVPWRAEGEPDIQEKAQAQQEPDEEDYTQAAWPARQDTEGDTGYAGTENKAYCKANWIQTSFVKRGRPFGEKKKEKDIVCFAQIENIRRQSLIQ